MTSSDKTDILEILTKNWLNNLITKLIWYSNSKLI